MGSSSRSNGTIGRPRHAVSALVVLTLALLSPGCGDDGLGAASIEAGNLACAKIIARTSAEIADAYRDPDLYVSSTGRQAVDFEAATIVPILVDGAELQRRKLKAILPPEEEDQVRDILDAYRDWLAKAKGNPELVAATNDVYNRARELAGEAGLDRCAENPSFIKG